MSLTERIRTNTKLVLEFISCMGTAGRPEYLSVYNFVSDLTVKFYEILSLRNIQLIVINSQF